LDADRLEEEEQVVAYWVLYIDLLFVSFDGNPFDAAWAAVVAALRDTKLPVARWDPDREMVVCSRTETRKLNVRGLPVACSAAVFMEKEHGEGGAGENRHWLLLDADRLEESLCREVITMVVDCSEGETRVKSIEKQGGTVLGRELIRGFAGVAEERWKEINEAMK
jgi:exosome complex component RRP43